MEYKSTAVVTGANGFVGSHLVDLLLEKGFIVRCVTRKSSDMKWLNGKNIEVYNCGLFDKEGLINAFKGADYIYHVAGVVKSKHPDGYYKGNVETTRTILDAALEYKDKIKKILIVSSLTAAGPSHNGIPVMEDIECHPITTYGKSKLEEEKLAKAYMDKLPITICRAPAVYGERDTEIFIFFQTFNRGLMTMVGLSDKPLSLIHAADLVKGFYLAAMCDKSAGEIYFISSEEIYNWKEIGEVTSKILGRDAVKIKIPHFIVYIVAAIAQFFAMFSPKPATLNLEKARDLVQKAWICDTSKAVKQLNYKQEISLEQGIRRTCEWYKEVKWL